MMEMVMAEMMQQLGTVLPMCLNTPLQLGVQDPADPMFSDILWIRREKDNGGGPQTQDALLHLLLDQSGILCINPPLPPHSHFVGLPHLRAHLDPLTMMP